MFQLTMPGSETAFWRIEAVLLGFSPAQATAIPSLLTLGFDMEPLVVGEWTSSFV